MYVALSRFRGSHDLMGMRSEKAILKFSSVILF